MNTSQQTEPRDITYPTAEGFDPRPAQFADTPAQAPGNCQTSHSPLPITEAYDIKNVDIRNLLTIVVGTLSNQTGESYDSVLSRGKCADEILRRFNELEAKPSDAIPADVYLIIKKQRDADEANLKAHAQRLADACRLWHKASLQPEDSKAQADFGNAAALASREALAQWEGSK